jgi:hypothetical protein
VILHDAGLAQWLGHPMVEIASFLVEEGCGAWSVGCRIYRSGVIAASADDSPFATPFGLFSGPGDGKNSNRGSFLAWTGAPCIFGGPLASTMAP